MKRSALERELKAAGCRLQRHGGNHGLWFNPANGRQAPIPRHNEIKDSLVRLIRKQLGI